MKSEMENLNFDDKTFLVPQENYFPDLNGEIMYILPINLDKPIKIVKEYTTEEYLEMIAEIFEKVKY